MHRWRAGCAAHPDTGVAVSPEGGHEWPHRTIGIDDDDAGLWPVEKGWIDMRGRVSAPTAYRLGRGRTPHTTETTVVVLGVVTGGPAVGRAPGTHRDVATVSFTGSTAAGAAAFVRFG